MDRFLKAIATAVELTSDAAFDWLDNVYKLGGESLLPFLLGTIALFPLADAVIWLVHS